MWLSHFRSWEMVVPRNLNDSTAFTELFMIVSGGRAGGFLLKSTIISTVLSVLSFRLFRLHQLLNLRSISRLVTVLDEADECGVVCKLQEFDRGVFRGAVVSVEGEAQWERNNPEGSSAWWCRCWMRIFPASLAAACLSGSWWSTDRWRWARRAVSVYSEGCPGWWCWKRSWSPQTGSLHKSLVFPDVGGCSAIPCWLHHPQTCLLGKKTAGGPARVQ